MLSIVVLDNEENFITYLNPEFLNLTENHEQYGLMTLSIEYYVESLADYNLFKNGNKIWVSGDKYLTDCLYVLNTPRDSDLFEKNNVVFEAEEVLVELNYAPYFTQTMITSTTGNVTVNYDFLNTLFGKYFNIGLVQDCLTTYLSSIKPVGTMSLMELLRFIEEETGNVFRTRYEKDAKSNVIHRYLDFLNPKNSSKNWELHLEYRFIDNETDASEANNEDTDETLPESDDIIEEEDIVKFPYVEDSNINPETTLFRLRHDNKILFSVGAESIKFNKDNEEYNAVIKYSNNKISVKLNNTEVINETINIPNNSFLEVCDTSKEEVDVIYYQTISPVLGNTHEEILDLGYNTENISYETDESDTYTAIAPVIGSNTDLTKAQLDTIIKDWLNLTVNKGDIVPMIVERISKDTSFKPTSNVSSDYWRKAVKQSSNDQVDWWQGTAYWRAPFNKREGEIYVTNDDMTGIEYTHIQGNPDNLDETSIVSTPKIGPVETSDEDPYAIFNDVCMKLKDKRYPDINIDLDIANLKDGLYNNYNIFDKVYVKIPGLGFEDFIEATVLKTEKNPLDIGENKVELTNYSVNKQVSQKETGITASNLNFNYPQSKTLTAQLINHDYAGDGDVQYLSNQLLTFTVYSIENESQTFTGNVYTKLTDNTGKASINIGLDPGKYIVNIQFGGDVEYASSNTEVNLSIGGTKAVEKKTTTVKETKKVKRYYTKYGVSPNKAQDTLCAIGKKSTGDKKKDSKFYVTVFKRKCPDCGSTKLFWSIFWAGNETKSLGVFPATGKKLKGSNKGRIVCKKCGKTWDALGGAINGKKNLTVHKKSSVTTKAKAYDLKDGNRVYDSIYKEYKVEKNLGNSGSEMSRTSSNTGINYSGLVTKKVRETAKNIVGNSTGIPAAQKIAKWIAKKINHETRAGLYQSPNTTLNRKRGNCLCKTDLFLQMCDATGVTSKYDLYYIHVGTMTYGKRHFFAKINGKYIDVDCTKFKKNPWGHACFNKRKVYSKNKYPKLPLSRKY